MQQEECSSGKERVEIGSVWTWEMMMAEMASGGRVLVPITRRPGTNEHPPITYGDPWRYLSISCIFLIIWVASCKRRRADRVPFDTHFV